MSVRGNDMKMYNSVCLVDRQSGEVVEDEVLLIGLQPVYVKRGMVRVFVSFLPDLLTLGNSLKLLFYVLNNLNNKLEVTLIPSQVRKELQVSRDTYHRWLRDLTSYGLLEKVDTYTYRLIPFKKNSKEV